MDSTPLLTSVLRVLQQHRLEAILIGNAGAALHGAPVTTLDFDFMFRETPVNLRKLKAVARTLRGVIMRPYYPVSKLYRLTGLQADFMPVIHGVRSFNSLRSRASRIEVGGHPLLLASLEDIIKSKRSAARLQDAAVLTILEATLNEKNAQSEGRAATGRLKSRSARRSARRV